MLKPFFIFIFCTACINACAQHPYWQQRVDYNITVTLNDSNHSLDGYEKIQYSNRSPDTLKFIWFHVWLNAYKNDKTAFSEQQLENGDTRFYFSSQEQRGYINQLDFRVNDVHAEIEDHPIDIDIIKVILPQPLPPGQQVLITTPFHVKLPYNFSRGGHIGQSYQITQWYPKPAVYDKEGWHPMPYLEQGEFYSEFGSYEVAITLPENYVVAATGQLQNKNENEWLKTRTSFEWKPVKQRKKIKGGSYKTTTQIFPHSAAAIKTLVFKQENVHDFAWFADKRFVVQYDTCMLASGKTVDVFGFYLPASQKQWQQSVRFTKQAVQFYSANVGEYPYSVISVVEGDPSKTGGMEYPTITLVSAGENATQLQEIITHEVGHNWFYGVLASNERTDPWMDEGMNTYYANRLLPEAGKPSRHNVIQQLSTIAFESVAATKQDQPIALSSTAFTPLNYGLSVYYKAAAWMSLLESASGRPIFDSIMRAYYNTWQFRHPYPKDFKYVVDSFGVKNSDSIFSLLNNKGSLNPVVKKKWKLAFISKPDPKNQYNYINLAPAVAFNFYDKLMLGGIIHNYSLPFRPFQFIAAPLYSTGSKQFNGIGRASYTWYPQQLFQKIEVAVSGEKFTENTYTDSAGLTTYLKFYKVVPQVRLTFNNNNPRSHIVRYIQAKAFFIHKDELLFSQDSLHTYTVAANNSTIAQLRYVTEQNRALYPYRWEFQIETSRDFMRVVYTGNYFFNYPNNSGLNMRWFAGKFFYLGDKTGSKRFNTDAYHLNMSTPKGYEDYTYSNYFLGRNEYEGFFSQQVMMRDGGFKVRTDLLGNKVAKTDDWLIALNFTSSFHPKVPIKLFADIGTYSDAWHADAQGSKLLFDAGIQLSLCKDLINVYLPLVYSKVYRDYFRSYPNNSFFQRISFSIDIQDIRFKKISSLIPF